VDIAEIVLISEDALINHLYCDIGFINSVPAEVYRCVGAFSQEMIKGENVFLNLLLAL
jgi:hypothetical protein